MSEADIGFIEENEAVPKHLHFTGRDPFYGQSNRVHLRLTSTTARLTIFEGAHGGNYPAGLDFLSRQRQGTSAEWGLLDRESTAQIESITK